MGEGKNKGWVGKGIREAQGRVQGRGKGRQARAKGQGRGRGRGRGKAGGTREHKVCV